ncbi:hypothetical protein [Silicimonas algicola]|uniref:Uncharacterized protein n=1 Tax=Silicimonas algicola TaxID=1826607 RepID=A0A316G6T3_9RHOB|nr:hypothetical protein [Silicimonas algicola]PWK56669.1 hypothetical protein C8D95_104343 [Silicimonas algicola]
MPKSKKPSQKAKKTSDESKGKAGHEQGQSRIPPGVDGGPGGKVSKSVRSPIPGRDKR